MKVHIKKTLAVNMRELPLNWPQRVSPLDIRVVPNYISYAISQINCVKCVVKEIISFLPNKIFISEYTYGLR